MSELAAGEDTPGTTAARRRWVWPLLLAALPPLLLLPDYLGGTPSLARLAWVLLVGQITGVVAWRLELRTQRPAVLARTDAPGGGTRRGGRQVAGLALAFAGVAAALSVAKYLAFGDLLAYDTAYYQQILWNTGEGRFLQGSILQSLYYDPPLRNDLGLHLSPAMLVLLPAYLVAPSPFTLLVLRALALALAAWPAYRLARLTVGPSLALPLAGAFLLQPMVIHQPLHGFYPLVLALAPLLAALAAYVERRFWPFCAWLLLALLVREDVGVAVAGLGLLALVERWLGRGDGPWRGWRWVLVPGIGGPVWLLLASAVLMPALGGQASGQAVLGWYAVHGSTPGEILLRLATDPAHLLRSLFGGDRSYYLYRLIRPLALWPLLGPASLAALPMLAVNLLAGGSQPPTLAIGSHYSLLLGPLLFFAALQALRRWTPRLGARGLRLGVLAVVAASASALVDALPAEELRRLVPPPQRAALAEAVALVPPRVPVVASSHVLPALANREQLAPLERIFLGRMPRPDYVVYDRDRSRYYVRPTEEQALQRRLADFFGDPAYQRIYDRQGVIVLRRRPTTPTTSTLPRP